VDGPSKAGGHGKTPIMVGETEKQGFSSGPRKNEAHLVFLCWGKIDALRSGTFVHSGD